MLGRLVRSGRYVIAVDTFHGVRFADASQRPGDGAWSDAAHRLWRLERENTMANLRSNGVPVVSWEGTGSLDTVLRDVARLGSAPRGVWR